MLVLIVLVVFTFVLFAWGALTVYMARGDRNVVSPSYDRQRLVWTLPDGTRITDEQLHDVARRITVAMTANTQQFTRALQRAAEGFRKAAPTVRQFNERFNAAIEAMSPEDRAEWDRLNA